MTAIFAGTTRGPRFVFDGQSLNFAPLATNYPRTTMANFPAVPWNNIGVAGTSWTVLGNTALQRTDRWAAKSNFSVLIMCGGTSDILAPESNDGPTVYSDMVGYGNARRAAGFDYVIATTITPDTAMTGTENTNRVNANALILGDASAAFDVKVDFAGNASLSDASNATYYTDGLHWTTAGAAVAASMMTPVLTTLLVSHP